MRYPDGAEVRPGDVVEIDLNYRGVVVACMDSHAYLPGQESWAYLREGIMVDTDFGGLVHFTADATDQLKLIRRSSP